jgi:type I restriction enzyme S subunit
MNAKKFKDLYFFHPKSKVQAGEGMDEGEYPFYTSSSVLKKRIDKSGFNTQALVFGTGGSASIHYANGQFNVSTDCFVVSSKQEEVNIKYVYYYLSYNIHILERGFKGAGLKHISKGYIKDILINYPDFDTQNKIVAVLDKASGLVKKREETIAKYDELLRATFLEMFGIKNLDFKNWEEVTIETLLKNTKRSARTGPFGSSLKHERFREEGEIAVIGIDNAVDNVFAWKKKRFLPLEDFEEFKNYQLFPRDVVITIMGTVGRSAVIPEDIGLAINTKHLAALTLDEKKCNPFYLAFSIHSNPYLTQQLKGRSRGAIMEGFNLTLIKALKLKYPPITLQNKFETIYRKCLANTQKLNKAASLYSILSNAISQLAFKGELSFNTAVDLEVLLENDYDFFKTHSTIQSIQLLLERLDKNELNDKKIYEEEVYNKAKSFVFGLLQEGRIKQAFDAETKNLKLELA